MQFQESDDGVSVGARTKRNGRFFPSAMVVATTLYSKINIGYGIPEPRPRS